MYSPEVPYWVAYTAGWAFTGFALLFAFVLVLDLGILLTRLVRRRALSRSALAKWRYGVAALAVVVSGFGVAQATRVPDVRQVDIQIPGLAPALDGFRLVQLSDLHISVLFPEPWVEEVVTRTNALAPDLVVITGDLIDGTLQARATDVRPLAKLRARDGVIAIPGNHEYYFGNEGWMAKFREAGMHSLINQHEMSAIHAGNWSSPVSPTRSPPDTEVRTDWAIWPCAVHRPMRRSCCSTIDPPGSTRRLPPGSICSCPGIPMAG